MSLVVLRSQPGGDSSTFTCQFDEPLIFSEKSQVQLVSTVFETDPTFEITAANKTCSYQLQKSQPFVTATLPEGTYTPSEMRLALERALNAVIPQQGASIHVTMQYNGDNLFTGYTFRFETGYKSSPPSFQYDTAVITQTQPTTGTKLVIDDVGVDGWDDKHAWSSEAFTRGRGTYRARFPYTVPACICLTETPLEDGDTDRTPYMSVGIAESGDTQYSVNGTQTIVPTATWNPGQNDYYQFVRATGRIAIQVSDDNGTTWTNLYTNNDADIPMTLYPGVIGYAKDNDIDRILQIPDGNTYDSTEKIGTRSPDDPYFSENPADGATLHDDGLGTIKRLGGSSIMTFNPGDLAETLGFGSAPLVSPATRTWSFSNPNPLDARAEHPALMISLPQLKLKSRNGATSQTGSILGVIPRLTAISNGNLIYEPRVGLPVGVSFARETPINTITVEIRQLDGTPSSLRGISIVNIWVQ